MDIAGVRGKAARVAAALLGRGAASGIRELAAELTAALRTRPRPPTGIHELGEALCEEMAARRDGRPVELRFERFPDEIGVTGLWVEFRDFDLVIVEERAEEVQQLVILGHELWHLHAGHRHHHGVGSEAANALAGQPGWDTDALTVAARDGSRQADEADADDFGHRIAARLRRYLSEPGPAGETSPVQRTLGYRGRRGGAR
ncbi:toxin-antitoxin system, toxin component family protein [Streptomyces sp. NPDC002588]|uniref:toxin-antitoxin system, toxin component family protein n=1 Tax=Streptomyces sp. NPDC002588 TaxID=3154419 RepID=UPI00332D8C4D